MGDAAGALLGAIQKEFEEGAAGGPGDTIVDYVLVAVVQNFETGEETTYLTNSAADGRGLPEWKIRGLLHQGIEDLTYGPDED